MSGKNPFRMYSQTTFDDEYRKLQEKLEARNLFVPRMAIEEMRLLCAMMENPEPEAVPDDAAPENETIDIVTQLFQNHKDKLQQREMQGSVSAPELSVNEGKLTPDQSPFHELKVTIADQNPMGGGHGRRLRNRVPRNHARETERIEPRNQTKRQPKIETEEYRELRRFLKERDLYKPPMDIEEMREVCQAIEQSMKEMSLKQPEFEEWTFVEADHRQEPLREDNWPVSNELNPIFADYVNDQITTLSPPNVPVAKSPDQVESPPGWSPPSKTDVLTLSVPPNVDSDSDTEYSPDNPGPCCRVIHVVHVEVHPEPREDRDEEPDDSPQKSCVARLNGSMPSRSVPTNAWDAIDEFF